MKSYHASVFAEQLQSGCYVVVSDDVPIMVEGPLFDTLFRLAAAKKVPPPQRLTPAAKAKPKVAPKKSSSNGTAAAPRPFKLSPEQWLSVRTQRLAGAPVAELATRFGVTDQAVYARARAEKWPKPGKAPKPTSAGTEGPLRRCGDCGQKTTTTPCAHCGK